MSLARVDWLFQVSLALEATAVTGKTVVSCIVFTMCHAEATCCGYFRRVNLVI